MSSVRDQGEPLLLEKTAYGALGFSRSLLSQMISLYLMFFYTDVFGIPVQYVGVMLLAFSIWDGCSKQLAGLFMGKTKSRHGKYRPYLLWLILPFTILFVAIFITPGLSMPYKILYACSTYLIWAVVSHTISVAHNAILPTLSKNMLVRTQANSMKIIFSVLAAITISSSALKLVDIMGGGDSQKGFVLTALGLAIVAAPVQYFAFKNIKERHPGVDEVKISAKTAIRSVFTDRRMIIFFLIYCIYWMSCTFKNHSATYYIMYVLERPEYVGVFAMIGTTASFAMHFFVKRIISRVKIETVMLIGIANMITGILVMYAAQRNLFLLSLGNVIFGLASALPANLIYIILADYVDKKSSEYKVNLGSWLYSSMDNFAKIGTGISGAVFSRLLYTFGYEPNLPQRTSALLGIRLGFSAGPAIAALACLILIIIYMRTSDRRSRDKTVELVSQ